MRGSDQRSGSLFSYVDLDARVRKDHPLRAVREIVNAALALLHPDAIYASGMGRPLTIQPGTRPLSARTATGARP